MQTLMLATPSANCQSLEAKFCILTYISRKGQEPHRTPTEKRFTGRNTYSTVILPVQERISLCNVHLRSTF